MLTGELRSQNDRIWDAFWSGGISNQLEVMEQITYLLFIRLDELHTREGNKATATKKPMERRIFPEGKDPGKRPYYDLRWSRLTERGVMDPGLLYEAPFTDLAPTGPDGIFKAAQVGELIAVLTRVRAAAVAA